jgi:hypothetical protein
MKTSLIELNTDEISINESLFPDTEKDAFVQEHLQYYYSKINSVPTIVIRVESASIFVVRGHSYLTTAKELKLKKIRVVLDEGSTAESVVRLLRKPSVLQLDWKKVKREEENLLFEYNWYVFFFKRSISEAEKSVFDEHILRFFRRLEFPIFFKVPDERIQNLSYSHSGYCAEFQAYVPTLDERWYSPFRLAMEEFNLNCIPIASFQGRKFNHY